jgi:hypothetical protein
MSRALFQAATVLFLVCLWASPLTAQETSVRPPEPTRPPPAAAAAADTAQRTNADETFDLNITERRITERDFAASTSMEAGEESARGLRLRVGVEVGANEIDVLLRNVQGRVRFRATLARVLERLNSRQAPVTAP